MPNILLTSLGTSWAIIPELIGFTNPAQYPFYNDHPARRQLDEWRQQYGIEPVREIWAVTTRGDEIRKNLEKLKHWLSQIHFDLQLKIYSSERLEDINTYRDVQMMSELILRTVLHASHEKKDGKLYLSLAGGRKTMSADMQMAAYLFGCDALIHVLGKSGINPGETNTLNNFVGDHFPISKYFEPVVIQGKTDPSPIVEVATRILPTKYLVSEENNNFPRPTLLQEIRERQRKSANSFVHLYTSRRRKEAQSSFTAFHLLTPATINKLREEKIGVNVSNRNSDLAWLKKLPKADLHCHLGGILHPEEMILVARSELPAVEKTAAENPLFKQWWDIIRDDVRKNRLDSLNVHNPGVDIAEYWKNRGVPEPLAVSAFLSTFNGKPEALEKFLYRDIDHFKAIGLEKYQRLGDFQGSNLLQSPKTLRETCRILKNQCLQNNIRYLELRCSPENYTRGGMKGEEVVNILMDELSGDNPVVRLIFIATRHRDHQVLKKHIDLALKLLETNEHFKRMFAGFDLAGDEHAASPGDLRKDFLEILGKSIPVTIHAGENMPVKNIWEAVYHLSAERIGHGLTLNEDASLKERIKERKIAIEMCPSSNDQIVGYRDFLFNHQDKTKIIYPLRDYLYNGLKVTVNTDDPGISLTDLTGEYYKAAGLTRGGLSKWEILQIIRNGFKYAFYPLESKRKMLLQVEEELVNILSPEGPS